MCAQSQHGSYSFVRHLAMSLYLNNWQESSAAMFTAYFDGSGHPDSTSAVAVAGFVAPTVQWLKFDKSWQACLDEFRVSELHMKDFAHSVGEFSSWKGDEQKRRGFLGALIKIIKLRASSSFASAVLMEDYRRVNKHFLLEENIKPFPLAAMSCIARTIQWGESSNLKADKIMFLFEDGDKDRGQFRDRAERDYGITPLFRPKSASVVFQAADLLAYEHFYVNDKLSKIPKSGQLEFEKLRHPLKALRSIPGSEDWGMHTEDDMAESCKQANIPRVSPLP
jgi:hypothetical protein